ncbi:MAG: hypothetical protein NHB32_14285 [Fischerella sp. CENA71]|nr:hypothetical protein [Fischerella sp. CENA71]
MPKNNHPAKLAITIAGSEDRTYYFDDRSEFDDFVRGLLISTDDGREFATDFKLYTKAKDAWCEGLPRNFRGQASEKNNSPLPLNKQETSLPPKVGDNAGEWQEFELNPYDYFTDIDDTDYPLAHGQLLANYSQCVNHKTLWDIAQGNSKAIALIDDAFTRSRVETTFKRLSELGAWASDESDPVFTEYETEDQDFDEELDHWLTQI